MIKNILFDLDGTIIDSEEFSALCTQYGLIEVFGKVPENENVKELRGLPVSKIMEDKYGEAGKNAYKIAREHFNNNVHKLGLYEGIREVIEKFSNYGYMLGIVTSSKKISAYKMLGANSITEFFSAIVCAEDTEMHKPDPEPILLCMKMIGAKPNETVYIGDTQYDILAAKRAGIKAFGAGWGNPCIRCLQESCAEKIFYRPLDFLKYINEINA
ncbi:HAD family hydrolase [Caldiplasma sukawensis]